MRKRRRKKRKRKKRKGTESDEFVKWNGRPCDLTRKQSDLTREL